MTGRPAWQSDQERELSARVAGAHAVNSGAMDAMAARPTTVKPAGPFGGNSQSGRTAQHGTQSGYVMHRRHKQEACQPCKDAHAAYVRRPAMADDAYSGNPYLDSGLH